MTAQVCCDILAEDWCDILDREVANSSSGWSAYESSSL